MYILGVDRLAGRQAGRHEGEKWESGREKRKLGWYAVQSTVI